MDPDQQGLLKFVTYLTFRTLKKGGVATFPYKELPTSKHHGLS